MPELDFAIVGAEPARHSETQALAFQLRITNRISGEPVHAILLRCQIQIEAPRRRYNAREQEELRDLFGEPERWGQTLRPMLWANVNVNVPAFTATIDYAVNVPCTGDPDIASAKYFRALEGGIVPLNFLFSGRVFYGAEKGVQVAPIPWSKEARFRLPVEKVS